MIQGTNQRKRALEKVGVIQRQTPPEMGFVGLSLLKRLLVLAGMFVKFLHHNHSKIMV